MGSGSVEFAEALNYVTLRAGLKNMSGHWNGCVSPEDFINKEWKLAVTEPVFALKPASRDAFDKGGNLRFWVLRDTGSDEIVSACQTLQRPGFRSLPGATATGAISCYTIGAVFTPKQHRGKGYAKRLLSSLVKQLDSIAENGDYYTLYSAVGLFYAQFGFRAPNHKVYNYEFDATAATRDSNETDVEYIRSSDKVDEILKLDALNLVRVMRSCTGKDGHSRVALVPKIETVQFWHGRALETARILGKDVDNLASYGGQKGSKFALWYEDYDHNVLVLLRLGSTAQDDDDGGEEKDVKGQNDYLSLLEAAVEHAANLGFPSLHVWEEDMPSLALKAATSSLNPRKIERQLALPMIRDAGGSTDSSVWDMDSRIAWF